jgi:hypothetical protein
MSLQVHTNSVVYNLFIVGEECPYRYIQTVVYNLFIVGEECPYRYIQTLLFIIYL